jgi:hypothetical protein
VDRPDRGPVLALAGRRVDAPGETIPRFPLERVPLVRRRIRRLLEERQPTRLVCSAACGADLLALEEADALGIRHHIVLPFDPARFRETSVADRPGDWVVTYDRLVAGAMGTRGLTVLKELSTGSGAAYAAANRAILEEALRSAQADARGGQPRAVLAVIVWDGRSRGEGDATEGFAREARAMNMDVVEIRTL